MEIPYNALGFEVTKPILRTIYERIRNRSENYNQVLGELEKFAKAGIRIPLNVVVGRQDATPEETAMLRRINLPEDTAERARLFAKAVDGVTIHETVTLSFSCGRYEGGALSQCFISLVGPERLNHISMPASGSEIHFTEDIDQPGQYYEFVPFNNPFTENPKKTSIQTSALKRRTRPAARPKPTQTGHKSTHGWTDEPAIEITNDEGSGGNVYPPRSTTVSSSSTTAPLQTSSSSTSTTVAPTPTTAPPKPKPKKKTMINLNELRKKGGRSTRRRRALRKTRKAYV